MLFVTGHLGPQFLWSLIAVPYLGIESMLACRLTRELKLGVIRDSVTCPTNVPHSLVFARVLFRASTVTIADITAGTESTVGVGVDQGMLHLHVIDCNLFSL